MNQIVPSDFSTTSLGELKRLPFAVAARTVIAPVSVRARDAAGRAFAGDEPPLPVARVAVGPARGVAEERDRAGRGVVAEHAVRGDVGPEEVAGEPDGAFGPCAAGPEALHPSAGHGEAREARIERHVRVVVERS